MHRLKFVKMYIHGLDSSIPTLPFSPFLQNRGSDTPHGSGLETQWGQAILQTALGSMESKLSKEMIVYLSIPLLLLN